jgi:transcriptional regulator GlxA family with amidase domain
LILGFEDAQLLDITGPFALFATANGLRPAQPPYAIELAARRAGPLLTSAGLTLGASLSYMEMAPGDLKGLDTLMVVGGEGTRAAYEDDELISFIARAARQAARTVSVCTGSFLLAKAGLLAGRRATTHWAACARLRALHPEIEVEENAIYVRDGAVWTSAGVTAGMDLALALIAEDLGREVALQVAQRAVMFMMRPGGQSQFSAMLGTQAKEGGRLGALIAWMRENPHADLSVADLAARAHMSERTLARVFVAEIGETPARFVERLRVDAARTSLTSGASPIERVAQVSGFGSGEQMRRAFQRHMGVSPAEFRARFRAPAERRIEA